MCGIAWRIGTEGGLSASRDASSFEAILDAEYAPYCLPIVFQKLGECHRMLVISKEQVSSLERPLRRRLGQEVITALRQSSPHSLQGLKASEIDERLDFALAGADLYELVDVRDVQAYVRLGFTIGPRFDEHPPFKRILADQKIIPRLRMKTLFACATASDWVLAAVNDIVGRFLVPLETSSMLPTKLDAGAIALVPIRAQHAEQYFRLSLHPDVWRLAGLHPFQTLEMCEQYLLRFGDGSGRHSLAVVGPGGELVGAISLFRSDNEARLSYWVGRPYWGQGVGNAALIQLTERLKSQGGKFRIVATVYRGNSLSFRVLEKCGFSTNENAQSASGESDTLHYSRAF